jgi:hypothetical protein
MGYADSHLTYIANGQARYDVYGPEPGPMLGIVERHGRMWAATSVEHGLVTVGDARWEAAVRAWPKGSLRGRSDA